MTKTFAVLILLSAATSAAGDTLLCRNTTAVSTDKFTSATTSDSTAEHLQPQTWLVDTQRGWKQEGGDEFQGSCTENRGYTVCRANTVTYGEAVFSLHPDQRSFVLVYIDYGLDVLAYAGTCNAQ